MDDEKVTGNVWADAGHAQLGKSNDAGSLPDDNNDGQHPDSSRQAKASPDATPEHKPKTVRSKGSKRGSIMKKAKRSRYPLLILFSYVSWVVSAFVAVDAAVTGVCAIWMPSYWKAAQNASVISQEILLNEKLAELHEIYLNKRFFETHLKCLVRAAHIAHDHFGGFPYQSFASIHNDTTKWIQSECDRIILSPICIPQNGWARYWRAIMNKTEATLQRLKGIADGWFIAKDDIPKKQPDNTTTVTFSLPAGYRSECNDAGSFCRIFFESPANSTIDSQSSERTILHSDSLPVSRLVESCTKVHAWSIMVQHVAPWVSILWVVFLAIFAARDDTETAAEMSKEELLYFIGENFLRQLFGCWVYFCHQEISWKDFHATEITVPTYTLHSAVISHSLFRLAERLILSSQSTSYDGLKRAFRELRAIWIEKPSEHEGGSDSKDRTKEEQSIEEPQTASEASKRPTFHVSPKTSLQQDLESMRRHMHSSGSQTPHDFTINTHQSSHSSSDKIPTKVSEESDRDSGWTVVTPASSLTAEAPHPSISQDDIDITKRPATAPPVPTHDQSPSPTTDDGLDRCGLCRGDGTKSPLLLCDNVDCPLQWLHPECDGITDPSQLIRVLGSSNWVCRYCRTGEAYR